MRVKNAAPDENRAGTIENTNGRGSATPFAAERVRILRSKVKVILKREERKLEKQRDEVQEAGQYVRYGQIADSLMADPASAPRGKALAAVINIHTQEIEEIALNPAFNAVENAELLYRKARKGKRGYETAANKSAETEANIDKLQKIIADIEALIAEKQPDELNDEDAARAYEIATEFVPPPALNSKGRPIIEPPPPPFKRYVIDGWEVFLGKNSQQNDELSTRFAKPSDIWLHVAAYAGSHVIIRHQKNTDNPPKTVIEKAAQLAVLHSKAKHTSFAEVHVTEARFVRKRRHAPPGEVIAERCKTVRVEPKDFS